MQSKANLHQFLFVLMIFCSFFYVTTVFGQGAGNTPVDPDKVPTQQLGTQHGGNYVDWAFDVKQTCDGGYISCGFTQINNNGSHIDQPAITKYDVNGNVEWDNVYSSVTPNVLSRSEEVVETPNNTFVAIGYEQGPNRKMLFIEVEADGTLLTGPKLLTHSENGETYYDASVTTKGNAIRVVEETGGGYGFIVAADSNGPLKEIPAADNGGVSTDNLGGNDMLLLRLDDKGDYVWSRNLGGIGLNDEGRGVAVHPQGGFVIVGRRSDLASTDDGVDVDTGCGVLDDTQIYIVRTDNNGDNPWQVVIDSKQGVMNQTGALIPDVNNKNITFSDDFYKYEQFTDCDSFGFDYEDDNLGPQHAGVCGTAFPVCASTSNDKAIQPAIDDDGNIVVSAYFHHNDAQNPNCAACPYPFHREADIVLVKLQEDGTPIFVENVAHFTGLDFQAKIDVDRQDGGYVIVGATANSVLKGSNSGAVNNYLVKTDSDGTRLWGKAFNGPANIGSCAFGVAATTDGGYVVAGNNPNGNHQDNRVLVKLYSDCQPNYQEYTEEFEPNVNSVSGSDAWNGSMQIGAHVVVESGKTLKILSGTRVDFADTRQLNDYSTLATNNNALIKRVGITVEPGGTLVIEDGVILKGLNACGENVGNGTTGSNMWEGIEVLMDTQTGAIGEVIVNGKGNAHIQDALVGIRAGKLQYDSKGQAFSLYNKINTLIGGSLDIDGATFENNHIDVDIVGPYQPNNSSGINDPTYYFKNSRFLSTDALADPNFIDGDCERLGNEIHIHLRSTKNVYLTESNFFKNTYRSHEGYGIKSSLSSASIQKKNHFEDLKFGIHASFANFFGAEIFQIEGEPYDPATSTFDERNKFVNNEFGTYTRGTAVNFTFANNFLTHYTPNPDFPFWGLYLDGTQRYLVHDNEFIAADVTEQRVVGVLANNTWYNHINYVTKNKFTNLNAGVVGWQNNGLTRDDGGLKVRCNEFSHVDVFYPYADIQLFSELGGEVGSIHATQGDFVPYVFTDPQSQYIKHIRAPAGNAFSTCSYNNPTQATTHTKSSSDALQFIYYHHDNIPYAPECFEQALSSFDIGSPFDATYSCNGLTEKKQALANGQLETDLNNTQAEIDQLEQNNGDVELISYLKSDKAMGEMVLLEDYTANNSTVSSITYLEGTPNDANSIQLLPFYMENTDYTKASTKVNSLPSGTAEWQQYKDMANMSISLKSSGDDYIEMTPLQLADIETIASSGTVYSADAKSILNHINGIEYTVSLPDLFGTSSSKRLNTSFTSELDRSLKVQPNPSKNSSVISWSSFEKTPTHLLVYNAFGQIVRSYDLEQGQSEIVFDTEQMENGLYIGVLTSNTKVLERHKILIAK
ncbi:MAG: T9SS type A sorting domain-containing protein [Chitinophagales bacterium]